MINFSNINERILYLIDNQYNNNNKKFAESIGFAPQVIFNIVSGRKSKPSYDVLEAIISTNDDISSEWLLTGKGVMLKSEREVAVKVDDSDGFPLVSIKAIGGFGGSAFAIMPQDVKEYYKIPKFSNKRIDFMIEVEGSSMYPKYNSGDIVACTVIKESKFIQWNKTHVVATHEQGIIIKRVKKGTSDDSLCMVSDNTSYDPFEVPKDEINGIALVVGVIRLE